MSKFNNLKQIVAKLREPGGCPWDRAQTHDSLKPACVEEASEVISGINILRETGNPENLKEELGDLLLQVMMHARIAEEEGLFTIEDVLDTVSDKMIRRHPHVFGTAEADTPAEALRNWEEVKKQEKAGKAWMDDYLRNAFDEVNVLIEAAKKRKGF